MTILRLLKNYQNVNMKKLLLSVAFAFVGLSAAFAQEPYPCHTDEVTQEYEESLSSEERVQLQKKKAAYELEIQNYIANNPQITSGYTEKSGTISYIIPVVFHIIHEGGPENISDAQIKNALKHLNDDYQNLNTHSNPIVTEFANLVADIQVEFRLAKKDDSGNCTNGITRTFSSASDGGSESQRINAVKAEHGDWPGTKYLNFFIAKDIGGAAGYTRYPVNGGSTMSNGIHVLHNYVGSIGTAGSSGTHTLAHEVGHWLNLPHLWGNSNEPGLESNCQLDDGIADTPITKGWKTCDLQGESCGSLDNVQNFMEYSYCTEMFTHGQKARMHAALNSGIGGRKNIHKASNLAHTGASFTGSVCDVDFDANVKVVCQGETVTFEDLTYNEITSRQWSFEGGSPATATSESPVVSYDTPGVYEVKLVVSDGTNSLEERKSTFITVLNDGATIPLMEGFEGSDNIDYSFWRTENPDGNNKFDISSDAAYTGNHTLKLENFGQAAGSIDAIVSQPVDLSNATEDVTISFRHAYRRTDPSNREYLKVLISNSCGEDWNQRRTLSSSLLGTDIATSSWAPASQNDWVTTHVLLPNSYLVDNFMVKFEFESDGGNNIYIDDINIYSGPSEPILGLEENNGFIQSFNVYPNPANDVANVSFTTETNQTVNVSLVNMMGQNIQHTTIHAKTGENLVMLNTNNIEAGVYFVNIDAGGIQQTKRLIIQ